MSAKHSSRAGYTIESVVRGNGVFAQVYRFTCAGCGAHGDVNRSASPEAGVKWLGQRGWSVNLNRPSRNLCAACIAKGRRTKPAEFQQTLPNDHRAVPFNPAFEVPMPTELKSVKADAVTRDMLPPIESLPAIRGDRAPTHNQRLKIRQELDMHFDDEPGAYLKGEDDGTIAARLDVPRMMVERIREAAYGPIRVNPQLEALKIDFANLRREAAGYAESLQDLTKAINILGERLSKFTGKAL